MPPEKNKHAKYALEVVLPLKTLYPEEHPKRIKQDSQRATSDDNPSKKKKKKHKTVAKSSETGKDPNSVSISDAKTELGDASDKEEVEKEPKKAC
jgi:hypothetical protein